MMRATRAIRFAGTPEEVLEFVFDDAVAAQGEALEPIHETRGRVGDSYAWTALSPFNEPQRCNHYLSAGSVI